GRTDFLRRGLQAIGTHRAEPLPPAVPDRHADLLDLPGARLPGRRARVLPALLRGAAAQAGELRLNRLPATQGDTHEYAKPPRTTPALRSLDPSDGLPPSGGGLQPRQAVRAP